MEVWWSSLHCCFWTPINMPQTHIGVCVYTQIHMYSLFFFYLNKSIWQPKPQRSPMHGFTPRLGSHQNKLKALRESQKKKKKWETERNRKRRKKNTKKPNNLSALTTIPHCHLHITPLPLPPPLPHPILSPAQLPIWKETGRNDIMHMKMSRKMFDLCMH